MMRRVLLCFLLAAKSVAAVEFYTPPTVGALTGLGTGVATWLATPSSANLASAVTGETGSGALVFADTPTLATPVLGVATATSINKVAITAPATSATLTIANGKTLTVNNTIAFSKGDDSGTVTFPSSSSTMARTDAGQSFTGDQTLLGSVVNLDWDATNSRLNIGGSSTALRDVYLVKTANNGVSFFAENPSTGTAGFASFTVRNSSGQWAMAKLSTGYTTSGLLVAETNYFVANTGPMLIGNSSATDVIFATAGTATTNERLRLDSVGNVSVGNAALSTNATDGFLYITCSAGVPAGTPTAKTGRVPITCDTSGNKVYAYLGGAWVALN